MTLVGLLLVTLVGASEPQGPILTPGVAVAPSAPAAGAPAIDAAWTPATISDVPIDSIVARPVFEPSLGIEDPFTRLTVPTVIPVLPTSRLDAKPATSDVDQASQGSTQKPESVHAVFTEAARFPLWSFDRQGSAFATDAATIYEGMHVAVHPGGRYEFSCVMEAPRMPVTIYLQLVVYRGTTPLGTITLPPFTLLPGALDGGLDLPQRVPSKSWRIEHAGYSHVLRGLGTTTAGEFSLSRTGTARFGSLPD